MAGSRRRVEEGGEGRRGKLWPCWVPWGGSRVPPAVLALPVMAGLWDASAPRLPETVFITLPSNAPLRVFILFISLSFFPLIREAFNKKLKFVNHFV